MERAKVIVALLIFLRFRGGAADTKFEFINECSQTVWLDTVAGANSPQLAKTIFELKTGESHSLQAPPGWSGRFSGRTLCSTDANGHFSCLTGNGATPATLVEITVGSDGNPDFYDVSLVDGYNLPVAVKPEDGTGSCGKAACEQDLSEHCPFKVRHGQDIIACRSACTAFKRPEFCCTGDFGTADTCKSTYFSRLFKGFCPNAYSFAFDDQTSTFTCENPTSYTVKFCPHS